MLILIVLLNYFLRAFENYFFEGKKGKETVNQLIFKSDFAIWAII